MKYRRYIVFEMPQFYPGGGLNDVAASFDTLKEAVEFIEAQEAGYNTDWDIVDRDTWEVIEC